MELGIPTILACGEKAFKEEAEAFTPGVITVAAKEGLLPDCGYPDATSEKYSVAKLSAAHLSPLKAIELIKEGAREAVELLKSSPETFKYSANISEPYKRVTEFRASKAEKKTVFSCVTEHPNSIIDLLNLQ